MISAGNDLNAAGTAIDELRAELEAARTRIAEQDAQAFADRSSSRLEIQRLHGEIEQLRAQGLSQEDRDDAARYRFCKQHGWPRRVTGSETLWYMDRAADNVEMVRSSFEECLDAAMGEPNV